MSQLQQTIQDILTNLKGLSSLKELLAELNYDRANVPLSTRNWSETATEKLADHPLLLATAGKDFHIIYCRLNSNQLRPTDERPIITQLLKEHPYALFIFSEREQTAWHFVNVKYDPKQEKRKSSAVLESVNTNNCERLWNALVYSMLMILVPSLP